MTRLRLSFVVAAVVALATAWAQGQSPARRAETPAGPSPGHALVTTGAKRVRAQLTIRFRAPRLEAEEWTVFAARLPELPGQVGARSAIFPEGMDLVERSDEARPILGTRVVVADPRQRTEMTVRIEYEATLLARKLVPMAADDPRPRVAPLSPNDANRYLASAGRFDHAAPAVQAWLDEQKLRRGPDEADVDLARRVFLGVKKGIAGTGEANGHQASRIFEARKADADGLVIALVSAFRGVGLPARFLAGRKAESSGVEPLSKRPYDPLCLRAEVHARGVGWVPADILGSGPDDTPDAARSFGLDPGDFVVSHEGTDLVLETPFGPKPIERLQDASFWALGGGDFDGMTTRSEWKVKAEPVDLASATAKASAPRPSAKASRKPAARKGRP